MRFPHYKNILVPFALISFVAIFLAPYDISAQRKPAPKTKPKPVKEVFSIQGDADSPAPPPVKKKEPITYGIRMERYVSSTTVQADGTSVSLIDQTYKFLNEIGLAQMSKYSREFNRDLTDVNYSDVHIIKADGKRIDVKPEFITKRRTPQSEAAPSFSSMYEASIDFGKLSVGDTVSFRMKVVESRLHFPGQFELYEILTDVLEWNGAEISIDGPPSLELLTEVQGVTGGLVGVENGRKRWKWTMPKTPAIELERGMSPISNKTPRVLATTFRDHASLGAAYWQEASKRSEITPAIQAKADEITKGITTPEEQAAAIYIWVNKNIRYLLLVVGRAGWVPNKASDILANGYGDCKDYTTLIHTLLKAKGIESQPVLIRSEVGDWFPTVATPSYFNHAILYIPSLDLFADGTAPNTRLGLISPEIIGKRALLAGSRNEVIKTHSDRPDDNQLISVTDLEVLTSGDVKVKASNTYTGTFELILRPLLGEDRSLADNLVPITLAMFGLDGRGKLTKVTSAFKVKEPFVMETDIELPAYTMVGKSGVFRFPEGSNLVSSTLIASYFTEEKRSTAMTLGASRIKEKIRITFPEGVAVDAGSLKDKTSSNSIVSAKTTYKVNGRVVDIEREIVTHRDRIEPEDYVPTRELINTALLNYNVELKYTSAVSYQRERENAVRKSPPSITSAIERMFMEQAEKYESITPAEAKRLEAKLALDPNDTKARSSLITYYSDLSGGRRASAKPSPTLSTLAKHRIWFIENQPELGDDEFFAFRYARRDPASADHLAIKSAWLRQIEANKLNAAIVVNAAKYLANTEKEKTAAISLLEDAAKRLPDDLAIFITLQSMFHEPIVYTTAVDAKPDATRLRKELEYGQRALIILKSERSESRDSARKDLLIDLAQEAIKIDESETAAKLARELILDFGQNDASLGYDEAAHVGNTILGRLELAKGNKDKAIDHLMISIRAPLRKRDGWLSEVNLTLARDLANAGERDSVIEFLKLCEDLPYLKKEAELYAEQIKKIKLWQVELKAGKVPSFRFYDPIPAKGSVKAVRVR